ncbi:MAG: hypothetical protein M1834_007612 [Cirrosporium novae-zelandiae]|nr:MAG: hypothetical protein M1834_007612 [Cirrosporium novae-zelandiae]
MPFKRAVSPVLFEPLIPDRSEILYESSGDEHDFVLPPSKRRRVEKLAKSYLAGHRLFIASASLRGPLVSPWVNPWKKPKAIEDRVGEPISQPQDRQDLVKGKRIKAERNHSINDVDQDEEVQETKQTDAEAKRDGMKYHTPPVIMSTEEATKSRQGKKSAKRERRRLRDLEKDRKYLLSQDDGLADKSSRTRSRNQDVSMVLLSQQYSFTRTIPESSLPLRGTPPDDISEKDTIIEERDHSQISLPGAKQTQTEHEISSSSFEAINTPSTKRNGKYSRRTIMKTNITPSFVTSGSRSEPVWESPSKSGFYKASFKQTRASEPPAPRIPSRSSFTSIAHNSDSFNSAEDFRRDHIPWKADPSLESNLSVTLSQEEGYVRATSTPIKSHTSHKHYGRQLTEPPKIRSSNKKQKKKYARSLHSRQSVHTLPSSPIVPKSEYQQRQRLFSQEATAENSGKNGSKKNSPPPLVTTKEKELEGPSAEDYRIKEPLAPMILYKEQEVEVSNIDVENDEDNAAAVPTEVDKAPASTTANEPPPSERKSPTVHDTYSEPLELVAQDAHKDPAPAGSTVSTADESVKGESVKGGSDRASVPETYPASHEPIGLRPLEYSYRSATSGSLKIDTRPATAMTATSHTTSINFYSAQVVSAGHGGINIPMSVAPSTDLRETTEHLNTRQSTFEDLRSESTRHNRGDEESSILSTQTMTARAQLALQDNFFSRITPAEEVLEVKYPNIDNATTPKPTTSHAVHTPSLSHERTAVTTPRQNTHAILNTFISPSSISTTKDWIKKQNARIDFGAMLSLNRDKNEVESIHEPLYSDDDKERNEGDHNDEDATMNNKEETSHTRTSLFGPSDIVSSKPPPPFPAPNSNPSPIDITSILDAPNRTSTPTSHSQTHSTYHSLLSPSIPLDDGQRISPPPNLDLDNIMDDVGSFLRSWDVESEMKRSIQTTSNNSGSMDKDKDKSKGTDRDRRDGRLSLSQSSERMTKTRRRDLSQSKRSVSASAQVEGSRW